MNAYPEIDQSVIWKVVEAANLARNEPETLDDAPYPDDFIRLLRTNVNLDKVKLTSLEDLETEIATIWTELDEFRDRLNAQTKEEVWAAYLKLKATLIQKLIELKERNYNMKTLRTFQDRVLKAMDLVMTSEQRTRITEILENGK